MKTAIELYPDESTEFGLLISDYDPIVLNIGDVALRVDDDDYQGDSRVIYIEPDGRVGYLNFGWGSCSGCDSLQACDSYEDVQELMDKLLSDIKWFDSSESALHWFLTHDWIGDYTFGSE